MEFDIKIIVNGAEQGLPQWMSYNKFTYSFAIFPFESHIGAYEIQIMAIDPFNAAGSVTFKLEVYQLEEKLAEVFSIGSSMTTYFAERFQGSLKDTEHYTVTISDDDVAFQDITLTPWIQYTPALR